MIPVPEQVTLDLSSDPSLASIFAVNEQLSGLLRSWWGRDLPIPRRLTPKFARAMVITMLGKAYKTHRAILGLCRAGYGEDAAVLLRTLFELALDVRYMAIEPTDRGRRWADYDWVVRYEYMQRAWSDPDYADTKPLIRPVRAKILRAARRVQTRWKFWQRNKGGVLSNPQRWSGLGLEKQALAVGWGLEYNTQFRVTSLYAHTSLRSLNDYIVESPSGHLRVRVVPTANEVDRVLPSAAKYLCYVAQDWLEVLKMPRNMKAELDALIDVMVRLSNQMIEARLMAASREERREAKGGER